MVTLPGFRLLTGGRSRVFVEVSKTVTVEALPPSDGKLVFRLKGAHVPVRTNRFPLVTTHFPTPVSRIALVESGEDVDLVIELRQAASAEHRMVASDPGQVLQVDVAPVGAAPGREAPAPPPSREAPPARDDGAGPEVFD